MKHIEAITPCFNEQDCIRPFYDEIEKALGGLKDYTFSVLYIDDGSTDNTLKEIKKLVDELGEEKIRYVSFSRNFGKEAALYAGLGNCNADLVAVLDVDLQHPPELLIEMLHAIEEEGYDCAGARRISRNGEPVIRSFLSRGFYRFINFATGMHLIPGMTDYRLMKKAVVDAIVSMPERERFTKGLYSWIGFKTKWINYYNVERVNGTSKWSVKGLWNYAKSGYVAFAATPLRGIVYLGMIVTIISFVYGIKVFFTAVNGNRVWQDTTTIILLLLFIGGVIITTLGIIGEYLARIYMEAKERPIYIKRESNVRKNSGK